MKKNAAWPNETNGIISKISYALSCHDIIIVIMVYKYAIVFNSAQESFGRGGWCCVATGCLFELVG
jgi:hypothetical protein